MYVIDVTFLFFFFFQAEDGIRDLVRSRGLGDVYKRQQLEDYTPMYKPSYDAAAEAYQKVKHLKNPDNLLMLICLKYLGRNFSNTMKSIIYEYILFKKH